MEIRRKPFQGVINIIRFNWHFYLLALVGMVLLIFLRDHLSVSLQSVLTVGTVVVFVIMLVSLFVSYSIYDRSGLYQLKWMDPFVEKADARILNMHAGFDETSE